MGLCVPSNWPHFSGILEVVSFYPLQVFQPYFQRSSLEGNQRYILFSGRLFLPNLGEMRKIRNIYNKRNKDKKNYFNNRCPRNYIRCKEQSFIIVIYLLPSINVPLFVSYSQIHLVHMMCGRCRTRKKYRWYPNIDQWSNWGDTRWLNWDLRSQTS